MKGHFRGWYDDGKIQENIAMNGVASFPHYFAPSLCETAFSKKRLSEATSCC